MRDKRPVDELSIEDLERVLAIRRREDRQKRLNRMKAAGRVVDAPEARPLPEAKAQPDTRLKTPSVTPTRPNTVPVAPVQPTPLNPGHFTLDALDAMLADRGQGTGPVAAVPVETGDTGDDYTAAPPPPPGSTTFELLDTDSVDDDLQPQRSARPPRRAGRVWTNRLLLLVEVAAVGGLVYLGVNLYQEIGNLQAESAEVQALAAEQMRIIIPTPAPTSVIEVVRVEDYVLPGGHKIDASGNFSFNYEELLGANIPAHLTDQVIRQALALDVERPQVTSETALQVFIPKLNVDAVIVQGSDVEALKRGVGQVQTGANPADASGNVALAAHNDVYGAIFEALPQLEPGDVIQVQTATQTYNYRMIGFEVVQPTDVHVLNEQGRPMVTLITCYPPGVNDKRYVVYAVREDAFGGQGS